jgi:hypothetical protein
LLVSGAIVALPAFASAAAADATPGGIGIRLVDVPVAEVQDPRALLYVVDHLVPGTIIHRQIEVANTTGSSAEVALYAAAATIGDGSFLGEVGHTPNELSSWTSVYPGGYVLPSHEREIALVTIAVPIDASPGERYAVVWAETRSKPTAGGVTRVNRVGIRLYVDIGPGGAPAADFAIDSLTAERSSTGAPAVVATVHNTGGRALDMSGTLDLSEGPGGLGAGPFPAVLGVTLGIGDTERVSIVLDEQLPNGPWDANLVLRSGLVERTAEAVITFPEAGSAIPVDTASTPSGPFLWVGVLTLLLIGIAALVAALSRRQRRPVPSVIR